MFRHWSASCLLWICGVTCALDLYIPQGRVATTKTVSGIFQVRLNDKYSINASMGSGICSALQVDIATKAQVQTALNNGLELCRFGWVEEKIAVVPRIIANPNCGKNNVGLVLWRATEDKLFDVFCFNNTGTGTTPRVTTTLSTPTTARQERRPSPRHSSPPHPTTPLLLLTPTLPRRPPLTTSTKPHSFLFPSTHTPLARKALSSTSTTTTTTTTTATTTTTTTTISHLSSSSRPPSVSSPVHPSFPSLHPPVQSGVLASAPSNQLVSSNTAEAPVIAVLIIVAIAVTTLAMLAMYYKKKGGSLPFRRQSQQKGAVETEMFKHFRERDLKRRPSAGDGERSRKCSSDITLLMEQEAKAEVA
ncbi:lymphatic vessel endothelial hyaluronic receptor 1b [Engraulis encrasicolus]|uniref:lymphatic vessel endothelial hyaluronic receptor 1b n=1 Tax=Engraulis encrasicolus TaxID=184585 RepID=UPI002FD76966